MLKIRKITQNDLQKLKEVIDSNELFPSHLLDEMSNDFFITYPDFFETCRMRPVMGEPIGTISYNYCAINEEQFAELCSLHGIQPTNFLKPEEVQTCHMFGEPVTK